MEIRGLVVLVTGSSSGIGRATALAFDREGARVAMAARRRERLEENAAKMTGALVLPTDLADEAQARAMVERTVDHFGRLDVLVNNAGTTILARSDSIDPRDMRQLMEANFIGAMVATQQAVRHMRRQGRGHVINVSSAGGLLGVPLQAAYSASKAAMTGWTRALQAEWAGTGIEVTEYQPGLVATEIGEAMARSSRLGTLDFSVFRSRKQSFVMRALSSPLPPEAVARDLVECVRRPRQVAYSNLLAWVTDRIGAAFPGVRLRIGTGMARSFRQHLGVSPFSE